MILYNLFSFDTVQNAPKGQKVFCNLRELLSLRQNGQKTGGVYLPYTLQLLYILSLHVIYVVLYALNALYNIPEQYHEVITGQNLSRGKNFLPRKKTFFLKFI